jgi:hypothetical protein
MANRYGRSADTNNKAGAAPAGSYPNSAIIAVQCRLTIPGFLHADLRS